jgi:hypothetical protein
MRSSSVSGKRLLALTRSLAVVRAVFVRFALSAAVLSLILCAPRPKPVMAPEPSVTLEGEVALVGDNPLDRAVVLSDAGGTVCALSSPRFEYELRNLAGHRVRVTGRVSGKTADGPEFLVEGYEFAPVAGRAPVKGTLAIRGAEIVLVASSSGGEYALAGPLADILRAFPGFKVWIDGPVKPSERNGGGGTIAVESYGILAPPAGTVHGPSAEAVLGPSESPTPARP